MVKRWVVVGLLLLVVLWLFGCAQIQKALNGVTPTITVGVWKDDGKGINLGVKIEAPEGVDEASEVESAPVEPESSSVIPVDNVNSDAAFGCPFVLHRPGLSSASGKNYWSEVLCRSVVPSALNGCLVVLDKRSYNCERPVVQGGRE